MNDDDTKLLIQEMQWVRKLLMAQSLAAGLKQRHLAAVLGVSDATVSRMLPKGLAKELAARARAVVAEE